MSRDDYAVIVGITSYPGLKNLEGCENDAEAFREWLVRADGGALPDDDQHVRRICSSQYDTATDPIEQRPICHDVDTAFNSIIELAKTRGEQLGRLYIFLAGHGLAPDIDDAAVLMANADDSLRLGFHIAGRPYARWFRTAAYFREVVLFMDCCRDVSESIPWRPPPWREIAGVAAADVRHLFGFATRWSRKSREREAPDGRVRGLFSRALLAGLHGGARDRRGRITGASLEGFVFNFLEDQLGEGEYQEPYFDYEKGRDVVLVGNAPVVTSRILIELDPAWTGSAVIQDGEFKIVASAQRAGSCWEPEPLPPGKYQIICEGGERRKVFSVFGGEDVHVRV